MARYTISIMMEEMDDRWDAAEVLPYENTGGEMETLFFEGMFASKKEAMEAKKDMASILRANKLKFQCINVNESIEKYTITITVHSTETEVNEIAKKTLPALLKKHKAPAYSTIKLITKDDIVTAMVEED